MLIYNDLTNHVIFAIIDGFFKKFLGKATFF